MLPAAVSPCLDRLCHLPTDYRQLPPAYQQL